MLNTSHPSLSDRSHLPKHSLLLLEHSVKNERKILKAFLLSQLNQLFQELFYQKIQDTKNGATKECYEVDSKIIQLLISGIVDTGDYTLEGIAYHTRIPLDVIVDAACGNYAEFSITPWARIVDLYIQVKPEVSQLLLEKLLEIKERNQAAFSTLLNEN